jgi:hypothetical protein
MFFGRTRILDVPGEVKLLLREQSRQASRRKHLRFIPNRRLGTNSQADNERLAKDPRPRGSRQGL